MINKIISTTYINHLHRQGSVVLIPGVYYLDVISSYYNKNCKLTFF